MRMKRSRSFRPMGGEPLEDRAVPASGVDVRLADIALVNQAFVRFQQSYLKDVTTFYAASGSSGARVRLNQAIGNDIDTLTDAVDDAIANLSAANPLLTASVNNSLGNLQTVLTNLPSPSGPASKATFLQRSFQGIGQTVVNVDAQIRQANVSSGAIGVATLRKAAGGIHLAFLSFINTYNGLVLSSASSPATNRGAFDAAVGTALKQLNANVGTALGGSGLPASVVSSLQATIAADLLDASSTGGRATLQSKLKLIPSPSTRSQASIALFKTRSNIVIGNGESLAFARLNAAVQRFNASH